MSTIALSFPINILRWSLLLYAVSLLVSMAGMELFGWVSWVLGMVLAYQQRVLFPRQFRTLDISLAGLFLVILVGALLNTPRPVDWETVVGSARWIFLFWGLRGALIVAGDDNFIKTFLKLWAGIAIWVGIYAIAQHLFGIDIVRWDQEDVKPMDDWPWGVGKIYRAVGFLGSPMTYGHSIAMVGCVFLGLWMGLKHFLPLGPQQNKASRTQSAVKLQEQLFLAAATFSAIGLFCSYTRGAWLAAIGGLLFMAGVIGRRVLAMMTIVIVSVLVAAAQLHPSFGRRFFSSIDKSTNSFGDRQTIWLANVEMFKDFPVLGIGYGENERLISSYYGKLGITEGQLGHAHNTFLQFLAGTGAVGTSLFLIFVLTIALFTWREFQGAKTELLRGLLLGILTAQIVMQLGGMTECNFKDAEVNHLYLFLAALISSVSANRRAV